MDRNAELLFSYLRDVIYHPTRAQLDVNELDEGFTQLGKGLVYFAQSVTEVNTLAAALARGDLSIDPPTSGNELAAPLKSLHASLRHITWQSTQVAKGDYRQHIDFMGEFSDAFNTMIRQLDNRQQALLREIEEGKQKTVALEQSNALLTNLAANIPQSMVVVAEGSGTVLFTNKAIERETDPAFIPTLVEEMKDHRAALRDGEPVEYVHNHLGITRYFSVASYALRWQDSDARAYMLEDISSEKQHLEDLEAHAYRDELTQLMNRFSGMNALNERLEEGRPFSICFIDLNNLKYINDHYGHLEGDHFIICTAEHLKAFSPEAKVCRLGGDEFMILADSCSDAQTRRRMEEISQSIRTDKYLEDKEYYYSISYGIVEVAADNTLPANQLLNLADERMYAHKRLQKQQRQEAAKLV